MQEVSRFRPFAARDCRYAPVQAVQSPSLVPSTSSGQALPRVAGVEGLCYSPDMGGVQGLKGMRHIALKVKDPARSKEFYCKFFGMDVVWEPDAENIYLSSGCDNIALHEITDAYAQGAAELQLDHLGFVVESIERVKELEQEFVSAGIKIVHPFKVHRDDSASFYCADPDGIVIQLLYEPTLSGQKII